MGRIINLLVVLIAKLHTKILTLNDTFGWALSDKWLHFIVIGLLGLGMIFVLQPLFKWLATHDGTLLITFIYVFTVILVITFAIEIGQWYSGTGDMDFYDIASGVAGFFVFFGVYLVGYLIYKSNDQKPSNIDKNEIEVEEEPVQTNKKKTKK